MPTVVWVVVKGECIYSKKKKKLYLLICKTCYFRCALKQKKKNQNQANEPALNHDFVSLIRFERCLRTNDGKSTEKLI